MENTKAYHMMLMYDRDNSDIDKITDAKDIKPVSDKATIDMLIMFDNIRILEEQLYHAKQVRDRAINRFNKARLKSLELDNPDYKSPLPREVEEMKWNVEVARYVKDAESKSEETK
jgi:hypothetical protein